MLSQGTFYVSECTSFQSKAIQPLPLGLEFQSQRKIKERGGEKKDLNIHSNEAAFANCLDHKEIAILQEST